MSVAARPPGPPRPTARAIVLKDDQLLVNHRRRGQQEFYSLPGGAFDPGETPAQTVVREVREETSLTVKAVRSLGSDQDPVWGPHDYWLCELVTDGEPQLEEGSREWHDNLQGDNWYQPIWLDINQLAQVELYPKNINELLQKAKDVNHG